jgi:Eukaryotic aspartyl protease/Avidin family
MNYANITGQWENEFGSIMTISYVNPDNGYFQGTYSSHTGASGTYFFVGLTDYSPSPTVNSQALSFAISWRSINSPNDDTQYWLSGFAGQYQIIDGFEVITTTYLMQKNTDPSDNWGSTIVDKATFKRYSSQEQVVDTQEIYKNYPNPPLLNTTNSVVFNLSMGKLSNNGGTPWVASVGLGTPSQPLRFMVDTGTMNTWITADQCNTQACLVHKSFDSTKSSTYINVDDNPQQKDFGPWGTMVVVIGQDNFTLQLSDNNGQKITGQTYEPLDLELAINYQGDQFAALACDGGIALPSPFWQVPANTQSLLLQLLADGQINYAVAAFGVNSYMGLGECLFGAINPNFFDISTLQYLPIKKPAAAGFEYLWDIDLQAFLVNGDSVSAGITDFILDTGSSYFKGPADLIGILVNAVTLNGELPTTVTNSFDLENYPTISLVIGYQTYNLSPSQYFIQLSSQEWILGIEVLEGMPEGMLLVGSVFLDTVYSIFDYSACFIGLARY